MVNWGSHSNTIFYLGKQLSAPPFMVSPPGIILTTRRGRQQQKKQQTRATPKHVTADRGENRWQRQATSRHIRETSSRQQTRRRLTSAGAHLRHDTTGGGSHWCLARACSICEVWVLASVWARERGTKREGRSERWLVAVVIRSNLNTYKIHTHTKISYGGCFM